MKLSGIIIKVLASCPPGLIRPVAFKYVAGATREDAVAKVRDLQARGICATMDVLGEAAATPAKVKEYVTQYIQLVDAIVRLELHSGISIKPTAFGFNFDRKLAAAAMRELIAYANAADIFVRIDMEDSSTTDWTLDFYRSMKSEYKRVGAVLQACLKRTLGDIESFGEGGADIRLCKGIYVESGEVAYKGYQRINENFLSCLELLLRKKIPVGIATHDIPLLRGGLELVEKLNVPKDRYEFQMLFGVRAHLAAKLAKDGHRIRVYVPFGVDWHPYAMRRLAENPFMAWHITKAVVMDPMTAVGRKLFGS